MSRWVDADEFIKIFMRSGCYGAEVINRVTQSLLDAPSIDIVRCGECKYYEDPKHKIFENCVKWKESHGIILPMKPNDSCSYGEREGE